MLVTMEDIFATLTLCIIMIFIYSRAAAPSSASRILG